MDNTPNSAQMILQTLGVVVYLCNKVDDLLLCLVAGQPCVQVGDDVSAQCAGQLVLLNKAKIIHNID